MTTFQKITFSFLAGFIFNFTALKAQDLLIQQSHIGFNIGVNLALGSHFQRLGLNFNFFYANGSFQANSEIRSYLNFRNLGPRGLYPELILSQGVLFGYGAKSVFFNPFLNPVSNQTGYLNSFAYSYNAFFNSKKTKQQTGLFSIEVNRVALITENDILARGYYDRFRTAAFLLQYQYEDKWQASINCSMWTGQYFKKKENNKPAFYNGCYMDSTNGIYTNYSHGLLSAQFKYNVQYSQNLQANIGVDAEQVRNLMQNKFIHDMRFVPRKWNKAKNCHLPMIDDKGNQFLYKEDQKIRKVKLYWNLFSNANLFY